jgi:hypothetical protein
MGQLIRQVDISPLLRFVAKFLDVLQNAVPALHQPVVAGSGVLVTLHALRGKGCESHTGPDLLVTTCE